MFNRHGDVQSVDDDDSDVAFQEAGEYTVVAETDARLERSTLELSRRDLTGCNERLIEVRVGPEGIHTGLLRTGMDCSGFSLG